MTARLFTRGLVILTAFVLAVPLTALADEATPPPVVSVDQTTAPVDEEPVAGAVEDDQETLLEEEVLFDPLDPEQAFREIVFPVVGDASFTATYGACRDRCTRFHMGTDIATYGWKGAPVIAAHDGKVVSTQVGGALSGCAVALEADDGWTTRYLHLNDDVPGTDLKDGRCFAPGIEVGTWVPAGTILGWVGDSGNAEDTVPHLHFEIRNPDGLAVEPWFSLVEAHHVDFSWIGSEDLLEISQAAFDPEVSIALVVDKDHLESLAVAQADVSALDAPVIPFDQADPEPAFAALRQLKPHRIVVLADGVRPAFTDSLMSFAPIVGVGLLPEPSEVPPETDAEPPLDPPDEVIELEFHYEAVENRIPILIAGRKLAAGIRSDVAELGFAHRIVTLATQNKVSADRGSDGVSRPDQEANRNVLWWNTSRGWVFSESVEAAPGTGIAYASTSTITPWTLAYLTSLSVAPPMPLWHHQPSPPPPARSL